MTIKEKKRYLKQYKQAVDKVNNLSQKIKDIELDSLPNGVSYDKINVQTSPTNDQMINQYIRKEDLITALTDAKTQSYKLCTNILKALDTLENDLYYNVLFKRYILLEDWDKIAYDLNYSEPYIYEIQGEALSEIIIPSKS